MSEKYFSRENFQWTAVGPKNLISEASTSQHVYVERLPKRFNKKELKNMYHLKNKSKSSVESYYFLNWKSTIIREKNKLKRS